MGKPRCTFLVALQKKCCHDSRESWQESVVGDSSTTAHVLLHVASAIEGWCAGNANSFLQAGGKILTLDRKPINCNLI